MTDLGTGALGLLATALALGLRHGVDWDHIAAITDVTSTAATADAAEDVHEHAHEHAAGHRHGHGGEPELQAHAVVAATIVAGDRGSAAVAPPPHIHEHVAEPDGEPGHVSLAAAHPDLAHERRRALVLGSLYALGHASVVVALGSLALLFGTVLPDWVDPIMGRLVGVTLVLLGAWVFVSLYQYARHGTAFRLRSRWMLVFDVVRHGWRRFQAALHGHEHVDPIEMSSYGVKTAFGVGMIHGVGAETGSQVLLIAAIGGASAEGLGVPMMLAFVVGLLVSNSAIVLITSTGFIASRVRERLYLVVGVVAGVFSLAIGLAFLFGAEGGLPSFEAFFEQLGVK